MDGRRHSVDLPISKALVALRRVRSLRDPSTNCLNKLSAALLDSSNWETTSSSAILSGLENSIHGDETIFHRWRNSVLNADVFRDETTMEGLDLGCLESAADCEGEEEEEEEEDEEFRASCDYGISCTHSKCEDWHRKLDSFPPADVISSSGSPCLSTGKAPKRHSRRGSPVYRNGDGCIMDFCHQGCGLSSCWSRNLKFRDSNLLYDAEERPLLRNGYRHNADGIVPSTESPRNLCQKFTPKSFKELVGHHAISTSLVSAISNQKITSLYLFHGPCGTGKTSASKIFAAALNCLSREIGRPCGICQECFLFFSGRSRDVKEIDPMRMNKPERCRSLIRNLGVPPVLSRFKVYIIDECHMLHHKTWAALLSCFEELPSHVVFIMITSNLDKLPRTAISKAQKYHFQKVKEIDIIRRLEKICSVEGLDFEQDALKFMAAKSNGSLRDAEMMLDQLSLLGRKITVPLVYEVNGVVSDQELLDLLRVALSCDVPNTVKKSRELMGSRIDPLQLVAQLANLIMDLLAGNPSNDGVGKKLFGAEMSEANTQQLSQALKILSQAEKQLRTSKNQTTWLTAALLQLSSGGSSIDVTDPRLSNLQSTHSQPQDGDMRSTSSTNESLKHPVPYSSEDLELQQDRETLELVWKKATGLCTPKSLKKFLWKHGKLASIRLAHDAGIAMAELEFDQSGHITRAEKSWKIIAGSIQHVLGYNVELRINLACNSSFSRNGKPTKKLNFSLFDCSKRASNLRSRFSADKGSNYSDITDAPRRIPTRDKYVETGRSQEACCNGKGLLNVIRCKEGNALTVGTTNGVNGSSSSEERISFPNGDHKSSTAECRHSVSPGFENKYGAMEFLKFHCWNTAVFPFRKVRKLRNKLSEDHRRHHAAEN